MEPFFETLNQTVWFNIFEKKSMTIKKCSFKIIVRAFKENSGIFVLKVVIFQMTNFDEFFYIS